jgi:hypothetical protein
MKFRSLLVAVVVLLILAGVLYWSEHRKTPETTSTPASPAILIVHPTDVTSITVKQRGSQPVTLVRSGAANWQIIAPSAFPADSSVVSGMLSSLAPLISQRLVEDKATDLSQFGLSDPTLEFDVTTKDNKTSRLLLGDDTPTGDATYVALAGDPRLFTAASYLKTSLNKSLTDLRDKRLLPVDAASVSSIDLTRKNQTIGFARVQNGWQIEKPASYRTDNFQVDDLLQQLTGAKWDPSANADTAAKAWPKATPIATAKLTGSSGVDSLEVRNDKDGYYAKSSAMPGTWKIDPSATSALDQDLTRSFDDFRNKQLFDFGYKDPEKIEYHAGATSLILARAGTSWLSNGKKMDSDSVENLVTALRDLAATKFVDPGFTTPQIEVTVTSNNGKRVESVQLQNTPDGGIAKREDSPALYALDSVTIKGLTDAVAALKPAAPPKK